MNYASNLVANVDVPHAWYNAGKQSYGWNSSGITTTVTWRAMGQQNCFNDTFAANQDPDSNTAFQIHDEQVFP